MQIAISNPPPTTTATRLAAPSIRPAPAVAAPIAMIGQEVTVTVKVVISVTVCPVGMGEIALVGAAVLLPGGEEVMAVEGAMLEVNVVDSVVDSVVVDVVDSVVDVADSVVDSAVDVVVVLGSPHPAMIGTAPGPFPIGTSSDPQSSDWPSQTSLLSQSKTAYADRKKESPKIGVLEAIPWLVSYTFSHLHR